MVVIMVVIQMVPGFYIGSRMTNLLLKSDQTARASAVISEEGRIAEVKVIDGGRGYATNPVVRANLAPEAVENRAVNKDSDAKFTVVTEDGKVVSI